MQKAGFLMTRLISKKPVHKPQAHADLPISDVLHSFYKLNILVVILYGLRKGVLTLSAATQKDMNLAYRNSKRGITPHPVESVSRLALVSAFTSYQFLMNGRTLSTDLPFIA